jgi:hypothetical protein
VTHSSSSDPNGLGVLILAAGSHQQTRSEAYIQHTSLESQFTSEVKLLALFQTNQGTV